jgi:CRISPR-associated protein Csd1
MILQALVDYYEQLSAQGRIAKPGWAKMKVSWALEIDENGQLLDVLPLRTPSGDGKKMLPREMELPAPVKRSSGVSANFLWDNSSYLLGMDNKGKGKRTAECFAAAGCLHQKLLSIVESPAAAAITAFFQTWDPKQGAHVTAFSEHRENLIAGDNLCFFFHGASVADDPLIRKAWENAYENTVDGETEFCLITGQKTVPELVHPAIKNVRDAQSSGAALVSFNAPAFCSYGKEQNANAPVSRYAAFAYTSALNQLLADREHVKVIGNTTVVYWSKSAEKQYQDAFAALFDGTDNTVTDEDLNALMESVAAGKPYRYEGLPLAPDNDFFILGISPNAARLSVRFFFRSSFGQLVQNLKQHYSDIQIVSDHRSKWVITPLWALLRETVSQKASDKSPLPQLAGDVMKSMLQGSRYPETLLNQTMLRIRAEHEISRGKAGIIKACLIRNTETHPERESIKEVTTVSLNTESSYTPYVLGRLFAVLEGTQQAANPGINATIKDRYFNSACATPAAVFPILLKLSNSHLKKLDTGKSIYLSRQIGELTDKMGTNFPAHLTLQEQGAFILGYYHQTQKRFEKKNNNEEAEQ